MPEYDHTAGMLAGGSNAVPAPSSQAAAGLPAQEQAQLQAGESVPSVRQTMLEQGGLAAVLALLAGYVDAYVFISYKSYASFMSGNTTQTGLQLGQGQL